MKIVEKFALIAIALTVFGMVERPAQAESVSASYFALSEGDPDVANDHGLGTVSTVVGAGLGLDGLPVASTFGIANLHDIDSTTDEIEWWSTALNSNVSVLNNPVYPSIITLPFTDDNMYTNTTVLGANGDDKSAFLTAEFTGNFTLTADAAVTLPTVCSDDDEFVYLSGGVFGNGTNVLDNGGIHGVSCNGNNNNASLLTDVAPGTYTLSVFYADREQTGAVFSIDLDTLPLTPTTTPEPGTIALLCAGLGIMGLPLLRRKRA